MWVCFGFLFFDYAQSVSTEYILLLLFYLMCLCLSLFFFYVKKQKYHQNAFNLIMILAHFRIIIGIQYMFANRQHRGPDLSESEEDHSLESKSHHS